MGRKQPNPPPPKWASRPYAPPAPPKKRRASKEQHMNTVIERHKCEATIYLTIKKDVEPGNKREVWEGEVVQAFLETELDINIGKSLKIDDDKLTIYRRIHMKGDPVKL